MPETLGVTWVKAIGSPNVVFHQTCTYVRQLESIVARWQNGEQSILQPMVAYPFMVLTMIQLELKKEAGRKEVELLGQSSGARNAVAGGTHAQVFQLEGAGEGATTSRVEGKIHRVGPGFGT